MLNFPRSCIAYPENEHITTTGLSGTLAKKFSQRQSNSGDIVLSSFGVGRIFPRASNPLAHGIRNQMKIIASVRLTCVLISQCHLSTIVLRTLEQFSVAKAGKGAQANLRGPFLSGRCPSIRYLHCHRSV